MENENQSYNALCELTTQIITEWRAEGRAWVSRPLAFEEACQRRPDLANNAVYPGGRWVNPAAHAGEPEPAKNKPQPPEDIADKAARKVKEEDERRIGTKR
jgi:hypothetical protein